MTQLYSYKGAYPYPLPVDMEGYDLNDFLLAPEKPNLLPDEKLEWTGTNWIAVKFNLAETEFKSRDVREERNKLLQESDVYVIKAYELNLPVSQQVIDYRQALRDITTQPGFPWEINWPTQP
jgi:Phage tail assembly chaperone protein